MAETDFIYVKLNRLHTMHTLKLTTAEGMVVDSYGEPPTGLCETDFMLIGMKIIRIIFFNGKLPRITGKNLIGGMKYSES